MIPSSDKLYYFGDALRNTGHLQEAEKVAKKAIALDPRSARNHQLLATILSDLGETDKAASEYKLAEHLRAPKPL
jgi:Flp pilus assembly protein TadD